MDNVGSRLREARKAQGLSQEDVAFRLDVSQTVVSRLERGVGRSSNLIRRMAKLLGLSVP